MIQKEELIEKIRTMGGLSNDEKAELIGSLHKTKKFGLVWENHPEDIEEQLRSQIPVLVEDKERFIAGEGEDAPNHLLIEGDNLEVLTALTYTHESQVDVIYIDPPYNTGNKDFVYNDTFVDKEDGYRHSKWLSFMNKRLKIAKRLLSDRGVIFISIDDNEQAQLKMLCDEVFGEGNFIASMPRITKASGKTTDKIAQNHDYVLIYSKNESECSIIGIPHDDKGYKFTDEYYSQRGKYKLNQTLDYDSLSYSASLDYPITIEGETFYPGGDYEQHIKRLNGNHKRADWEWRWSKELFEFGYNNGFIVVKSGKNGKRIYTKTYQGVSIEKDGESYRIVEKDRLKPVQSIQLIENMFSNDNAKKELGTIFSEIPFDYPKPTMIMRYMLQTIPNCSIILDFFAGSGTTLHATMQLNADDGGKRQCILVTNNENGICENVTYERNKRVIEGYTTPKGVQVEGLKNNSLRYYKVAYTPRESTSANRLELMRKATDMLCIKHDIYDEKKTFGSLQLKARFMRYFANDASTSSATKQMLVVYEPRAIAYIAKELRDHQELATKDRKLMIFVYSDGAYAYDDEFEGLHDVIELTALPDALNQAIRNILPEQDVDLDVDLNEEGGEA